MNKELFSKISGKIKLNEQLDRHTTIRIGGPCDYWIEPKDERDLKRGLEICRKNAIPAFVIGKGGHLLVRDEGYRGAVFSLTAESFKKRSVSGQRVVAGAGTSLAKLIRFTCEKGLEGLESMTGIPGTVGGAVFMNAGGWKNPIYSTIGDCVESVKVMDYDGVIHRLKKNKLAFGYRSSNLDDYVILEVTLKLKKLNKEALLNQCRKFLKMKRDKQTLDAPSAGCIFKNPEGKHFTSGQLIDMMGLKGKCSGRAQISNKHGNFIVNSGKATFRDVTKLIEMIRSEAKKNYDVDLDLEVRIL
ncbi:MAG: UDP-N-acetylmuramate dehydrogenase [Candidatus Omnitrophota bacterium]